MGLAGLTILAGSKQIIQALSLVILQYLAVFFFVMGASCDLLAAWVCERKGATISTFQESA
jgi:hypothetical protein